MSERKKKLRAMLTALVVMSFASACATEGTVGDYCAVAELIDYTDSDIDIMSELLMKGLVAHNDTWAAICEEG